MSLAGLGRECSRRRATHPASHRAVGGSTYLSLSSAGTPGLLSPAEDPHSGPAPAPNYRMGLSRRGHRSALGNDHPPSSQSLARVGLGQQLVRGRQAAAEPDEEIPSGGLEGLQSGRDAVSREP